MDNHYFRKITFIIDFLQGPKCAFINQMENKTHSYPANIYLLKTNNRNTRKRCEICSKLTIKTPESRQCGRGVVLVFFIVNFQHITPFSSVSFVDFEQVNFSWVGYSRIHGK